MRDIVRPSKREEVFEVDISVMEDIGVWRKEGIHIRNGIDNGP